MTLALLPFLLGLTCAIALVPLARLLAANAGVVAHPRDDRWHRQTVPLLGGLAIGAAVLLGAVTMGIAGEIAVPLAAAMLMCIVGFVDDVNGRWSCAPSWPRGQAARRPKETWR